MKRETCPQEEEIMKYYIAYGDGDGHGKATERHLHHMLSH